MRARHPFLLLLLALGCEGKGPVVAPTDSEDPGWSWEDTGTWGVDADGDGYPEGIDCDDHDPSVNPAALEVYGDGLDQDCDGMDGMPLGLADATFTGKTREWLGSSLAGAGDVNGDGYDDLLLGTREQGAYLVLGSEVPRSLGTAEASAAFLPDSEQPAGASVAGAGDVNGDGFDDLLVGRSPWGGGSSWESYLVLGGPEPASRLLSQADAVFSGTRADDRGASSVAGAGDVNGDGFDDILIGAPWARDELGAAFLVLGGPSPSSLDLEDADVRLSGDQELRRAGYAVAGAGDFDGDGFDDVLVGRYHTGRGEAWLVPGSAEPAWAFIANVGTPIEGGTADVSQGTHLAGAGDANADGYDDLLFGTEGRSSSDPEGSGTYGYPQQAYLVLGRAEPEPMSLSEADATYTGGWDAWEERTVAGAGDVDGDGHDDLLFGSPWYGKAWLLLGSPEPASQDLADCHRGFVEQERFSFAGAAVAGAGDVDGSGHADLLIGAPYGDDADGLVYLLLF